MAEKPQPKETYTLSSAEKTREAITYSYGVGKILDSIDILSRLIPVTSETGGSRGLTNVRQDLARISHELNDKIEELVGQLSTEEKATYAQMVTGRETLENDAEDQVKSLIVSKNISPIIYRQLQLETDSNTIQFVVNNFSADDTRAYRTLFPLNRAAYHIIYEVWQGMISRQNELHRQMTVDEKATYARLVRQMWDTRNQAKDELSNLVEEKLGLHLYFYLPPFPDYDKAGEEPEVQQEEVAVLPKETIWYERDCPHCHNSFKSTHEEGNCYSCTLEEITHGIAPEEGDFNTAKIRSGTMTDRDWKNLDIDLESVELGTPHPG